MHQQHEASNLSKAESARINGARSKGPVTPQGRANSANGNLKHGAYSKRILMEGENAEGYEFFKSTFVELFRPADAFQNECVESMVTPRWRIRRVPATQASNLNIALVSCKDEIAATFDEIDSAHERAVAVQSQMAAIEANTRVQERLHRIYARNYRLLARSRKTSGRDVPDSEPVNSTPEPQAPPSTPDLTDQPN